MFVVAKCNLYTLCHFYQNKIKLQKDLSLCNLIALLFINEAVIILENNSNEI